VPGDAAGDTAQQLHTSLVDALAGMPLLESLDTRRTLIRIISRSSGIRLPSIPESPTARAHLVDITYTCLGLPGGVRYLIGGLRLLDPAHPMIEEIERISNSLTVLDVVSPEENRKAQELLSQLPEIKIEPIWHAATDEATPPPSTSPETPAKAFEQLTGLNARPDGLPPAIAFVEIAACRVTGQLAAQLRLWADAQARRFGLSAELAALRRATVASPPPLIAPLPCLVVQFQEHAIKPGYYLLSHWIQHRPGTWSPVRGEVDTLRWADAEHAVEALVDRAETIWGTAPDW
jgi:hypothetical protein